MRKISKEAMQAFINDTPICIGNTKVIVDETTRMYLFGNMIAEKIEGHLFVTSAGWKTATTKERLNAIPGVSISQKNNTWYLNGKEWNGNRIKI